MCSVGEAPGTCLGTPDLSTWLITDANAKEDSRSNPRGIQLAGNRKSSGTRQRCGISLFIFSGKSISMIKPSILKWRDMSVDM